MAAVKRNLEGNGDLLCVAPVASYNNILRAASGFSDGPHEALGRGPGVRSRVFFFSNHVAWPFFTMLLAF